MVGYVIAGIKDLHSTKIGDTMTESERPATQALPGLRGRQADGLRLGLPDRVGRLREPARRDGEAPAERRLVHVRARVVDRPRLRLPLRLPRAPPPRDHPGAAGARVRPLAHHDRPVGPLPDHDDARRGPRDLEPGEAPRDAAHRRDRGAADPGDDHHEGRVPRGDPRALRGAPRPAGLARVRRHAARRPEVRPPAERGHPRLLRQAQVGLPRLRLVRLPADRLRPGRPREARRPHQRGARRRARLHRPPRQGARRRGAPSSRR